MKFREAVKKQDEVEAEYERIRKITNGIVKDYVWLLAERGELPRGLSNLSKEFHRLSLTWSFEDAEIKIWCTAFSGRHEMADDRFTRPLEEFIEFANSHAALANI